MRLFQWIDLYLASKPVGILIDDEAINGQAIIAAHQYNAYGYFAYQELFADHLDIDLNYCITDSEWAIIRPLFDLYVERENAIHLEASRGMGVDVFGRSVSEINSDIAQKESELPRLAFDEPVFTT